MKTKTKITAKHSWNSGRTYVARIVQTEYVAKKTHMFSSAMRLDNSIKRGISKEEGKIASRKHMATVNFMVGME